MRRILDNVPNFPYYPGRQQDPHEFLTEFLDALEKEVFGASLADVTNIVVKFGFADWNRFTPKTQVILKNADVFGLIDATGQVHLQLLLPTCAMLASSTQQSNKCECGHISFSPTIELDTGPVSVTMPDAVTVNEEENTVEFHDNTLKLQELFNANGAGEAPGYNCGKCRSITTLSTRAAYSEVPQICIVHLKRFFTIDKGKTRVKDKRRVEIPLTLEIPAELRTSTDAGPTRYSLVAVVFHIGSAIEGGHYTTAAKRGNEWVLYNDTTTYTFDVAQLNSEVCERDGYVFFYVKE
jgi:ubiquitin C-terminal hydrolase